MIVTNFFKVENIRFKIYFTRVHKSKYSYDYINHKIKIHGFLNLVFSCYLVICCIFSLFLPPKIKFVIPCCNRIAITAVTFFHDVIDRTNNTKLLCTSVYRKLSILENSLENTPRRDVNPEKLFPAFGLLFSLLFSR